MRCEIVICYTPVMVLLCTPCAISYIHIASCIGWHAALLLYHACLMDRGCMYERFIYWLIIQAVYDSCGDAALMVTH